jgi:hypothetical protein
MTYPKYGITKLQLIAINQIFISIYQAGLAFWFYTLDSVNEMAQLQ